MTPLETLMMLRENTTGAPRQVIKDHLAARDCITALDVSENFRVFSVRYGSSRKISEELLDRLDKFPVVRGNSQGAQLNSLYDLRKVIHFNIPKNPELFIMNLANGLALVRNKLPEKVQEEWGLYGHQYKLQNGGSHPPFHVFLQFLEVKAIYIGDDDFKVFHSVCKPQPSKTN